MNSLIPLGAGMMVEIRSKDDPDVIKGTAKVDEIDELGNILKLDAIPQGTEPGDFVTLEGATWPRSGFNRQ
jgi:hypothetical protein